MICQVCNKREATVMYTQIADDEKSVVYMCAACAAAQQAGKTRPAAGQEHKPAAGPASKPGAGKTAGPQGGEAGTSSDSAPPAASGGDAAVRCPQCGLDAEAFQKQGRLGCSACYETFSKQLERMLQRLHGATSHRGKGPVSSREKRDPGAELQELQQQLAEAVSAEAYERAATLRDRIRALQSGQTEPDGK